MSWLKSTQKNRVEGKKHGTKSRLTEVYVSIVRIDWLNRKRKRMNEVKAYIIYTWSYEYEYDWKKSEEENQSVVWCGVN